MTYKELHCVSSQNPSIKGWILDSTEIWKEGNTFPHLHIYKQSIYRGCVVIQTSDSSQIPRVVLTTCKKFSEITYGFQLALHSHRRDPRVVDKLAARCYARRKFGISRHNSPDTKIQSLVVNNGDFLITYQVRCRWKEGSTKGLKEGAPSFV